MRYAYLILLLCATSAFAQTTPPGSPFTEPFEINAGDGDNLLSVIPNSIRINGSGGGEIDSILFFLKDGISADKFEITYTNDPLIKSNRSGKVFTVTSNGALVLGTSSNIAINIPEGTAYTEIMGCRLYGPLSSAPSSGVGACDEYYDTDLNLTCTHNGTNFVQNDDWSTQCV